MKEFDEPLEGPIISEYCGPRNLRKLAASVIAQAVSDLIGSRTLEKQINAFLWLTSEPDFQAWLDLADTPFLDPYRHLFPNLRSVRRRLQYRISSQ